MTNTIYSLSSAHGRSGVAVIRISGPLSDQALVKLCGRLPQYRHASLMVISHPIDATHLDQGLVLRFAEGQSFTGEASCELQIHGGRAVVQSVLTALSRLEGFRQAKPGEFTRRAMENGRLDLTQVEALADLIDADTEFQRQQALRSLEGILGHEVRSWRGILREVRGLIAADIDFSDEGDVGDHSVDQIDSLLQRLEHEFVGMLASSKSGRIINEGFRVALVGPPNSGKSSLLNALAGSDVAIVTHYAGTTRDILEVRLDIEGYPIVLIDTAGIRDAIDPVEIIGVSRARFAATRADLILVLHEVLTEPLTIPDEWTEVKSIRIRSKLDLYQNNSETSGFDLAISVATSAGLSQLRAAIAHEVRCATQVESVVLSRERQRIAVERALFYCQRARSSVPFGIEFVDENVRAVDQALAELLGEIGIEEVLGEVFSRFCVGK
jgi:tRNA modification GTPase